MRKDFRKTAQQLHARPISDGELAALRESAANARTGAALAVQAREREHTIVYASVGELYKKYPEKRTMYAGCEEKTLRDMKLVMRYCVYSAALDDPDYARDRMHYWFRTILLAFNFGREFITDAYRIVQKRAATAIAPAENKVLHAMVDDAIQVYNS
ncbi:MAG: hypothetical protein SF028_15030 [Candidatus Sumerlaeia bacterium]|nr:hypothetical protein [Candidatus Sumerlaeia bacterium]